MASTGLSLARAVMTLIGAGALLLAVGGLTSGESVTDPVFPAGWRSEPCRLRRPPGWMPVAHRARCSCGQGWRL